MLLVSVSLSNCAKSSIAVSNNGVFKLLLFLFLVALEYLVTLLHSLQMKKLILLLLSQRTIAVMDMKTICSTNSNPPSLLSVSLISLLDFGSDFPDLFQLYFLRKGSVFEIFSTIS